MKNGKKGTGGFTLVELIVVIAILAILAGVGTVAYSGYVKKANQVADQQLLGAINTAFAAACIENGTDVQRVTSASMGLNADKTVNLNAVDPYADSFAKYYAGNESAAFRVTNSLVFDAEKHAFVDPATAGDITLSYGGGVLRITSEDIAALSESSFANQLGISSLLDQVDWVTDIAANLADENTSFNAFLRSDANMAGLAAALGYSDISDQNFQSKFMDMMSAKVTQLKEQDPETYGNMNESLLMNIASNQILANNAVLQAAQNSTRLDRNSILASLGEGMTAETFKAFMSGDENTDTGVALANAAAAYGMYTAYVNVSGDETLKETLGDAGQVFSGLQSEGFKDWVQNDPQAQKDLDGYLAAMSMINDSTGGDAVAELLINGFADQELKDLLTAAVNG